MEERILFYHQDFQPIPQDAVNKCKCTRIFLTVGILGEKKRVKLRVVEKTAFFLFIHM